MPGAGRGPVDALVIGGGIVGLAIAWRTAQRGQSVTVLDPSPGGGAARVAAGMLAPVSEVTYTEEPLLRLGRASAQLYPDFVAELEQASGQHVGHRTEGTLQVAFDPDDLAELDELRRFQVSLGIQAQRLTSRECRQLEPMLAPAVRGGILVGDDHSVDPRRLTRALLVAAEAAGVELCRRRAEALLVDHRGPDRRAAGVRLGDGSEIEADSVVLAAGCWSGHLAGLPAEVAPPVRPVKGQTLRLWAPEALVTRNVRALVRGSRVYAVPRADGEVVLGATTEELGYDTRVTAGGMWELLRDGRDVLPGITELELTESLAGLRPASPDNAPLLGATALPGLVVASGHYRNGVLLTPVTAEAVAGLLTGETGGQVSAAAAPFSPARFEPAPGAYGKARNPPPAGAAEEASEGAGA